MGIRLRPRLKDFREASLIIGMWRTCPVQSHMWKKIVIINKAEEMGSV